MRLALLIIAACGPKAVAPPPAPEPAPAPQPALSCEDRIERAHKHGTMRFVALVLALIGTAVLVTVAMFETLYYLLG